MDIAKLFDTDFPAWLTANADTARRVGAGLMKKGSGSPW